jgi:hypothetical protein
MSSNFCILGKPLVEHGFIGFGCFSRFCASLVVVALVGMSEKGKTFSFHCFFFCFFFFFWKF